MQDDRTPTLNLTLPHPDNKLEEDVLRLRDALAAMDAACAELAEGKANAQDLTAAIAGLQTGINNLGTTVAFLTNSKVGVVNGQPGPAVTLKPVHLGLGPATGASAVTLTRDAQGRLQQIVSTVDGKPCVETLAYDAAGALTTVTTVYEGRQRVETLTYDAAGLKSVAAVEAAV